MGKKYQILDDLAKKEEILTKVRSLKRAFTAGEIAKKAGCAHYCAKKVLEYFASKGTLYKMKIGYYTIYFTKDLKRYLNLKKYVEELENVQENKGKNEKVLE